MKNFLQHTMLILLLFVLSDTIAWAQPSPEATAENTVNGVKIKIDYHSPRVRERIIWGALVPYDQVWRTGANEATTIEVSDKVKIGKNKMPKGKYALFTIPRKGDTWTVIINKVADQWGAFDYDEKQDLFRFDVKVERLLDLAEELTFDIKDDGTVVFAWEYKTFSFKITP